MSLLSAKFINIYIDKIYISKIVLNPWKATWL